MSIRAVRHATVVTNDAQDRIIYDGALIMNGDRIEWVGKTDELEDKIRNADEVIDGTGKILIPGLINSHTHVVGQVFKGFTEDGAEGDFYRYCFPMEAYLNPENSYWFAMAGCTETMKFGCTFINDLYHYAAKTCEAVRDIGIRGVIEHKVYDIASLDNLKDKNYTRDYEAGRKRLKENERLIREWNGAAGGRIRCWVGNHATDTNSPELLKAGRRLADDYGVGIHIHVAQTAQEDEFIRGEYGMTPVAFLNSLGFLGNDVLCAHLAFATSEDIRILEDTGAQFLHCPVEMAKFATFPRIGEFLKSRVPMAMGDDWTNLNPWEDMRAAVEVTRAVTGDASLQNARRAFRMMTTDGARMFGMEKDLGSLEAGKKADVVMIDQYRVNLIPMKDVVPSLVYNMTGNEVEKVFVDGRLIVSDGKACNVDEDEMLRRVQKYAEEIWTRGGVWPPAG